MFFPFYPPCKTKIIAEGYVLVSTREENHWMVKDICQLYCYHNDDNSTDRRHLKRREHFEFQGTEVGYICYWASKRSVRGKYWSNSNFACLTHWLSELFAKNIFFLAILEIFSPEMDQTSDLLKNCTCNMTACVFFPLAQRFTTFFLRHAQKKFEILGFSFFFNVFAFLLLFLIFCCRGWPSTELASSAKHLRKRHRDGQTLPWGIHA